MEKGAHKGSLGDLVSRLIDEGYRTEGERFKVMMLSSPESLDTITLNQPIANEKRSKSGKATAFTMGQRYVLSDALLIARTTSEFDQTE